MDPLKCPKSIQLPNKPIILQVYQDSIPTELESRALEGFKIKQRHSTAVDGMDRGSAVVFYGLENVPATALFRAACGQVIGWVPGVDNIMLRNALEAVPGLHEDARFDYQHLSAISRPCNETKRAPAVFAMNRTEDGIIEAINILVDKE